MRLLLSSLFALFLLPSSANAARAVMEGIAASNNTVFVDTTTKRVHLSTQAYGDGVPTVSLYTASNVVVGDNNKIVLYATGTVAGQRVCFGDGTCQTTAAGGVLVTTAAAKSVNIAWGTAALVCKSTLTVSSGGTCDIVANVTHYIPSAGTISTGYLKNGQCPADHVCSTTQSTIRTPWKTVFGLNGGNAQNATIHVEETLSADDSICIWSANDAGATTTNNFLDFRIVCR